MRSVLNGCAMTALSNMSFRFISAELKTGLLLFQIELPSADAGRSMMVPDATSLWIN